jgi:acetoacetyl-CoA reductase/3-oxoacyl-[acyl-carrier protein] reductase
MIMTQCMALELAPSIRVNTIIPGLILTDETEKRFGLNDLAVRQTREDTIPLRRLGRPEDVADAVILMLSNESRFITVVLIDVLAGCDQPWLIRLDEA